MEYIIVKNKFILNICMFIYRILYAADEDGDKGSYEGDIAGLEVLVEDEGGEFLQSTRI